ncbi:hypothetical protein ACIRNI_31700 [Streptomyces sp. NPDC093546]|uniref:hypothetical protein n=1 Tax=Streptomyces sp. NPDC093546 TaxID=3366040 RepID=UPI00381C8D41
MLTAGRVALALVLGGLWCWAVLRLALAPGQAGVVEGFVAAGGWGISLLPVHAASPPPRRRPARRAFMATSAVRRRTNPWST